MPDLQIIRAEERFHTSGNAIETFHSFSYGSHYDPENLAFGPLRAINEEIVAPGAGYDEHRHSDMEIVTWVLEGALAHEDSTGNRGIIEPGTTQRLSAGTGVTHTERNASDTVPLRFVQMMVVPSEWGAEPAYASMEPQTGEGWADAVGIANAHARLVIGRLSAGHPARLPHADLRHLHVTRGSVLLGRETLAAGDCARVTDGAAYDLHAEDDTELLVWLMAEGIR